MSAVDSAFEEFTREGRVCPMPMSWADMYKMLPTGSGPKGPITAPLPLILAAWHDTQPYRKTMRFRMHLDWAAKHGVLEEVCAFLRSLPPDEWFTGHPSQY